MWKIKFYAVPIRNCDTINPTNIYRYIEMVEFIMANEKFEVPEEYYSKEMNNGETILEHCWKDGGDEDTKALFRTFISEIKISNESYDTLFKKCKIPISGTDIAFAGIEENLYISHVQLYVIEIAAVTWAKRFYLELCKDYDEFCEKIPSCFLNLIFHDNAFGKIRKLDKLKDNISEVIRHLCVLNDYAKELYITENDENNAMKILKSKYNVTCSGKGSNEGDFKLDFKNGNDIHQLTCNPHTKLYDGLNDYRIYFSWGRELIENGKIIIVKIGGHWDG